MSAAVGADIESICRKCGDVWHVVVAKVGETIAKVQCKECGGLHKHRAPGAKTATRIQRRRPGNGASNGNGSGNGRSTKRGTQSTAASTEPMVQPDLSKPIRPYSIRDSFAAGERIDHPKFGIGIVENASAPGKIEVFFPDGRRLLAQAKDSSAQPSPGISRPSWMASSDS